MVYGGGEFSIFVFLFSLLALVSVPQGRKREKGRTKKEKGKEAAGMVCGGGEFSIFVFLFSLLALVSVPLRGKEGGEKKKKEERRMKTGC
jgi:hypothetical protein